VLLAFALHCTSVHALDLKSLGQQVLAQNLGQELGRKLFEPQELAFLKSSGNLSADEYQTMLRQNQSETARLRQLLAQLPRELQAQANQQARIVFDQEMAGLRQRVQEWQTEQRQKQLQAQQQAAEDRNQQLLAAQRQREEVRLQQLELQRQQQLEAQQKAQQARQQQLQAQRKAQGARQRQPEQTRTQPERRAGQERATTASQNVARPQSTVATVRTTREQLESIQAVAVSPVSPQSAPGRNWTWILLAITAGGGICFFWIRRRASARALPAQMDEGAPAIRRSVSAETVYASGLATAPSPASAAAKASVPSGSLKQRLLAEQTAKYQATLSVAMDELQAARMALQECADVPERIRKDLARVGARVHETTRKLLRARVADTGRTLLNAFLLMPFVRRFRRAGFGFKVVMVIGVFWALGPVARAAAAGAYLQPVLVYLAVIVPICFFFERRSRIKGPVGALEQNSRNIQLPTLVHFYPDQAGTGAQWALRFWSASNQPACDEAQIGLPSVDPTTVPGAFFLALGDLATYRIDAHAAPALVANQANELMTLHGAVVAAAIAQHQEKLAAIIRHARHYGELKARERRQREEIPRLEALLSQVRRLEEIWQSVYVSDKVFEFLVRRIDLFNLRDRATPAGLLLYGYPGNGKEFLARTIAQSVFAQFVKPTVEQLASAKDVKEFWTEHADPGPVVIFVEFADQVFAKTGSEHDGAAAREVTLAWLEEWTKREAWQTGVWVVLAAQHELAVHPRILARLGSSKIEVTPPNTPADREHILVSACRENRLPGRAPQWLIDALGGASIRELREIVREAKVHSVPHPPTDEHWRAAVVAVRGSEGIDKSKTWDRLILPQDVKDQLKRAARILREADRYKDKKVNVPNILLFGPPGTGKTDIARTFANEGGVKFIAATTADLKAQYVGQSAHLVRDLFGRARAMAPCVLFIDEIESVAAKRGSPHADGFTQDTVTEMLAQMEGAQQSDRPVIVLAATNLPEQIDPAIANRFTSRIEIALPDEAARRELLRRLIAERPVDAALDVEEIAAFLAKRLHRKSGRDLVMIVNRAMERAVVDSDSPDAVRLTRELLIQEALPQGKEVSEAQLAQIWEQIVLAPQIKSDILDKIRMFNRADKAAPKGLLLYGPPGTGKTEIARRIADSASCHFMALKGPDLKAGFVGQSGERVQKIWEQARSRGRCVIFIDECEGVFARRGGTNADAASEELLQAFLAEWDGVGTEDQRVWVVGATNRRDRLDDAIISRFGAEVEIGLPEAAERLQILRLEMAKLERSTDIPAFLGQATTGMSGRNLSRIATDVCTLAGKHGGVITDALWRDVLKRYSKSGGEAVDPSARWESLILAETTLAKLKGVCEALRHIEVLRKQGVPAPKGALLFGPPGTGKTQIARTLANESGLPFLAAATADLKAGYTGQSVQKVRELFDRARGRAPCILFIDEIDAIAPARGGGDSDAFTIEIVNQLLQEMDGVRQSERHVYVLAATNRPEAVDEAIRSRLKDAIEIPNPDREQREQLFRLFLGKLRTDFDVEPLAAELARRTNNIGGRAISAMVERAAQEAVNRAIAAGTPEQVVLTRADVLREFEPRGKQVADADLARIWDQIVLKPDVKADLLEKIRMFNRADKAAPRGLLLYGPPGTGKTEIARRIAACASCHFMSLKGPDLKAGYVGQSGEKVKKVWEQARARGRCVIFVDECEGVFARRGGTNSDAASDEVVQAFLAEWDGVGSEVQQIWVVGATNRRDLLDDAIVSRFGAAVEIDLPGAAERLQILELEMAKLERPAKIPQLLGQLTTGMSGRTLARVASEVCTLASKSGGAITDDAWRAVLERHTKSSSEAVDAGARWESLVVSDEVLEKLRTLCESLRHVEEFKAQGFDVSKGALLYGPPGTGKTQIARTLANESGLPFIAATTADLKAGFVGQSGQKVRELFERARSRAPCILFIDEIEAVGAARGGAGADAFTGEIVNQLLQEMDGVRQSARHVFVLAATNLPDAVDAALLSRFEEQIEIPHPDAGQRERLFRLFLGKLPCDFDREQLAAHLAASCYDISGREIRSIVQKASQRAIRRAAGDSRNVRLVRDDFVRSLPSPSALHAPLH
jgi:SpoVK/Ycf46/Vps4 family AAA+-type ATPase